MMLGCWDAGAERSAPGVLRWYRTRGANLRGLRLGGDVVTAIEVEGEVVNRGKVKGHHVLFHLQISCFANPPRTP